MEKQIIKLLKSYGLESWVCGGTARDRYLGHTPAGYDIAVATTLSQLREKLQAKIIRINEYDISVTVNYMKTDFVLYPLKQIKLMNTYFNYDFVDSLQKDASTRDFTMNSLYYDPLENKWFDFYNSRADINNKVVKFIGSPKTRILESKVRLVRAVVFCGILGSGWKLDKETHAAIEKYRLKAVPIHPKQMYLEIHKLLTRVEKPSRVFRLMRATKLLETVFPELRDSIGIEQSNKRENLDLFDHIMYAIDAISQNKPNTFIVRSAALLHDIGKPYAEVETSTGTHFYNHENISGYLASDRILVRWGYQKNIIEQVVLLIKNHVFDASVKKSLQSIKKLIAKVGAKNIHDLLDLRIADRIGTGRKNMDMSKIYSLRDKINIQLAKISPNNFKLQISEIQLKKVLSKKTDAVNEALPEAIKYLEHKVLYGRLTNKISSLRKAFSKINNINCPLDKPHLFKTWFKLQDNTADVFPDGILKCGVFCNFICNSIIKRK